MSAENPTAGDSGASIEERLERMFAAEQPQESQPQPEAKGQPDAKDATQAEETTEPENGDPDKGQEPQLSTSELAKIFGLEESAFDVDETGTLVIKTKIDGKEGAAKLSDLVKTYQLQGHVDNRSRAVAEQEKALQTRMQEVERAVQDRVNQVEQLANVAGAELMREYQSIDWNSLRQQDAGQYAALQQDFANRRNQIQGVFQTIQVQRAQQAQAFEVQKAQYLQSEAAKLPTLIPEWKDEAVRRKESQDLIDWSRKQGFSDDQIKALNESSAMHVALMRKAMLFDTQQAQKPLVENKVRQAPKIVRPGQAVDNSKEAKLSELKQNVRKTGGKGGTLEALLIAKGIA